MLDPIVRKLLVSSDPFRVTVWDGSITELTPGLLSDICILLLRRDLSPVCATYEPVDVGDTIAFHDRSTTGKQLIYHCRYEGITSVSSEFFVQLLYGDGRKKLNNRLNLNRGIPYLTARDKLTRSHRVTQSELSQFNGTLAQELATSIDVDRYLQSRLGKAELGLSRIAIDSGQAQLELLVRTKLLLVIDKRRDEIESLMRTPLSDSAYFTDIFPIAFRTSASDPDEDVISSLPYQHCHAQAEVLIFNRFSDAMDFVEMNQEQRFVIVTDKYNQVYSPSVWQRVAANDNYSLLHLAKWTDFRKLHNEGLVRNDDETIKKVVLKGDPARRHEIRSRISQVNSVEVQELIEQIACSREAVKDVYPELGITHTRYINMICRALALEDPEREYIRKLDVTTNLSLSEVAVKTINGGNPKREHIASLASESPVVILTDNVEKIQRIGIRGVTARDVVDCYKPVSDGSRLVIYYIDKWFLMNTLFPLIMLQQLELRNLLFVLYPSEVRALYGIHRQFSRRVKPFFRNRRLLSGEYIEVEDEVDIETETYVDYHEITCDFRSLSRRYFIHHAEKESATHVKAISIGLRGEGRDYIAFLSKNYRPHLLDGDDLKLVSVDSLAVNDTLVFFEGAGERGILEAYKDIFFSDDTEHIRNMNRWKQHLEKYLRIEEGRCNPDRMRSLLRDLKQRNLFRSEADVYRWLSDESIATLNPREDFERIAYAVGSPAFIAEYETLADSCVHLQVKSKLVGRVLKKLALRDFSGADGEIRSGSLGDKVRERLEQIIQKVKCLRVVYVDRQEQFVLRNDANVLLETSNG